MMKLIPLLKCDNFSTKCASILKSSWELVMLNWDSPVEDVPEIVVEIFNQLMTLWEAVKCELPNFADNILKVLQETPWFVKGKYRILGMLLKYVSLEQVGYLL